MLHGASQDQRSMARLERLFKKAGYPTETPNLPVHDKRFKVSDYGRIAAAAFERFKRVVLVGHSLGGRILPYTVQELQINTDTEVVGLVRINSPSVKPPSSKVIIDPSLHKYQPGYLETAIRDIDDDYKEFKRPESDPFLLNGCSEKDIAEITAGYRKQAKNIEVDPIDCPNDIPKLSIVGWEDYAINPYFTAATAEYDGSVVVPMTGGHFMHIPQAPDVAKAIIRNFGLPLVQREVLDLSGSPSA